MTNMRILILIFAFLVLALKRGEGGEMERVIVSKDGRGFALEVSGEKFAPWGFNYDRDAKGRLIEDYWETEWPKVEADFREMKALGANVVRVHLQVGKFLEAADRPNEASLKRLARLLELAERERLYLDLTGLGCYHKQDVPAWYDALDEAGRWKAQGRFWEAVAERSATSPAVFCYDVMNEPVVPGGKRAGNDWLGGAFGGSYFVQFVTLDQNGRPRPEIAKTWLHTMKTAIRKRDPKHLITVGLVDWSLDRPGLTSGFVPEKVAGELDFIAVHLYPAKGKLAEASATLKGFSIGKPLVIEETFPLSCSIEEFGRFIDDSKGSATGWVGFYWGETIAELRREKTISAAITAAWLEFFQERARRNR